MSRSLRHDVAEQLKVHPSNKRNFQTAHTSNYLLRVQESGSTHTNLGATGSVTLTLPGTSATKGTTFTFVVQAEQLLTISPGTLGAIYIAGAKQSDNESISSNSIGDSITLECDGNHDWVVTAREGTWGQAIEEEQYDPATRVFARGEFGRRLYTKAVLSDWSVAKSVLSADRDWVVSGSGTTYAGSTATDGGGVIKPSTSGAFAFIKPMTGSRFDRIKWNTNKSPRFRFVVKTGTITDARILIGLESVGHPKFLRDSAPDSNRVEVYLDQDADSRWHARAGYGSNGSSSATLTGVVASNTVYDIEIRVNSSRVPSVYVNSALLWTGSESLIANKALIPVIGLQSEGAARLMSVFHVIGSQNIT